MSIRSLRRLFAGVVLTAAVLGATAMSAFADQRDFTLNNTSSSDFDGVYISPSAAATWGDNVISNLVLPAGGSVPITFPNAVDGLCTYDIKVTTPDGATGQLSNVDLCSTTNVTFSDSSS